MLIKITKLSSVISNQLYHKLYLKCNELSILCYYNFYSSFFIFSVFFLKRSLQSVFIGILFIVNIADVRKSYFIHLERTVLMGLDMGRYSTKIYPIRSNRTEFSGINYFYIEKTGYSSD